MPKATVPRITSFRLDDTLYKAINDLAAERKTKPGKLIREALQDLLAREMVKEITRAA